MREFKDIAAFQRHMPMVLLQARLAGNVGLHDAATLIQTEARKELGTYQGAVGPFVAWKELAESTKIDRLWLGYPENEPELRSGELRDAIETYSGDGEAAVGVPNREVGTKGDERNPRRNIGEVAEEQELGGRIPPRSFLGGSAARKEHEAVDLIAGAVVAALADLPKRTRPTAKEDLAANSVSDIPF